MKKGTYIGREEAYDLWKCPYCQRVTGQVALDCYGKEEKMKVKGVEIKRGDRIHGFSVSVPGYWEVESLRPFRVVAHQNGKKWNLDVTPTEWAEKRKKEALERN